MARSRSLPMLTRLALLLVRPSEGRLDQDEQRRIGRQRWAMWLIILYNSLAWSIFAIGDGSNLLKGLLPATFTQAVDAVIKEYDWLPILIIPYGLSALLSIDVHLNAAASWSANDVHDKRVKATFSTIVI